MEVLWFLVENKAWGEWLLGMLGIWGPGHEGKYRLIYENFSNYTNLSSRGGSRGAGWSHLVRAQGQHGLPSWKGWKEGQPAWVLFLSCVPP